jgi:hypothetical protein
MANFIGGIMSLVLSVVLIASVVVPTVINQNTTGWDASTVTIFGLVSLISVAGLVFAAGNLFGLV